MLGYNNKISEIHLSFHESFLLEESISLTSKLLLFIFTRLYLLFYCSVLHFYFSNNFKLIDSLVSIGWWYTWFIIGSNIIWKYSYHGWLSIFFDSDETSPSATALNYFHIIYQSIFGNVQFENKQKLTYCVIFLQSLTKYLSKIVWGNKFWFLTRPQTFETYIFK